MLTGKTGETMITHSVKKRLTLFKTILTENVTNWTSFGKKRLKRLKKGLNDCPMLLLWKYHIRGIFWRFRWFFGCFRPFFSHCATLWTKRLFVLFKTVDEAMNAAEITQWDFHSQEQCWSAAVTETLVWLVNFFVKKLSVPKSHFMLTRKTVFRVFVIYCLQCDVVFNKCSEQRVLRWFFDKIMMTLQTLVWVFG